MIFLLVECSTTPGERPNLPTEFDPGCGRRPMGISWNLWVICWRLNGIMAWEIWRYSSMAISGTDWLEVPTICKAYVRGYTPKIWPTIWYSTSILGSWNSHWTHGNSWDLMRLIGANFISRWSYIFPKRSCVETWNNGWPSLLARSYQKYVSFNNQSNWLETSHQLKIF